MLGSGHRLLWDHLDMIESKRERCWTEGGAYSQVTWDPDTGCSEIKDFDSADRLIARHE
jgi:hypothetical protein